MCFIERYFKDCKRKDYLNNLLMERAHFVKLFNEHNLKEYVSLVYEVFDKKIKGRM